MVFMHVDARFQNSVYECTASSFLADIPLSLVWFFHSDEDESCVQFNESITPKSLRQYVSQLITGVDVLHLHPVFFNRLLDEMVVCINMFAAVVKYRFRLCWMAN
jgi:hypothetical protein